MSSSNSSSATSSLSTSFASRSLSASTGSSTSSPQPSESLLRPLLGGVVGGVVGAAIVIAVGVILLRRHRRRYYGEPSGAKYPEVYNRAGVGRFEVSSSDLVEPFIQRHSDALEMPPTNFGKRFRERSAAVTQNRDDGIDNGGPSQEGESSDQDKALPTNATLGVQDVLEVVRLLHSEPPRGLAPPRYER